METVYFLYGLSFVIMGAVILIVWRPGDVFGLGDSAWLLGAFGLVHGLNEWAEIVLIRNPGADTIRQLSGAMLPLSFAFLVLFGAVSLYRSGRAFKWAIAAPVIFAALWAISQLFGNGAVAARYFLCVPGCAMSSVAIYLAAVKKRSYKIPVSIIASAISISILLAVYAFLAGLIVPKSNFFPSTVLNYDNFLALTGSPVQLFRMACAILIMVFSVLASSIVHIVNGRILVRGGIRTKIIISICASTLLTSVIIILFLSILGDNILRTTIGRDREKLAAMAGASLAHYIAADIEDAEALAVRPFWVSFALKSGKKYDGMGPEKVKSIMLEKDLVWLDPEKCKELSRDVIGNGATLGMPDLMYLRKNYAEVFITDRFGGVVASSGKTTDYYQADEDWWIESYNNGSGHVYVSDIEYDQSSGKWVMSIAVPMYDDLRHVAGIVKLSIDSERISNNMRDFRVGSTGRAAIVNSKGKVLFHSEMVPMSEDYIADKNLAYLSGKRSANWTGTRKIHGLGKSLIAAYRIDPPGLKEKGIFWYSVITQDTYEALEPLNELIAVVTFASFGVIFLVLPIGYLISGIFVKPIRKLKMATEHVMAGNWDYPISAKTGDEIEEFADAFSAMIANIRVRTTELQFAKDELERLSINLEHKVSERTKDLSQSHEATLNILEDLTEAKERIEKESKALAQALEIKSSFTSTVSHELRTPLAAIKEGIAIVLDGTAGALNKEQMDFLLIARRNVDRLTRLVNDVLDFQKLERHGIPFNMALGSINDTVKEVASSMLQLVESKGLTITLELDDELPRVFFDKDRIAQVLTNLIGNSVKFTENGGITITTSPGSNFIQVSVSDTGPGIAEKDMPRLFKQFDQIQPDTKRKVGGTGLGLAICKGIVEAHNGKIWAESIEDKGSVFSFILPIRERGI